MHIEALKTFCDLVETRSFTKAAQINKITQSAVSQQISSMEGQFHGLLIERSKKQFRLTREGEVLYEYSKQILRTYEGLESQLGQLKDIVSGTIRVAVIYVFGLHDLPPFLRTYLQQHPKVNVHIEYRHAREIYADVLSNVVDLGVVAYPEASPTLTVVPLWKDKLSVICHPQHPLAKLKTVELKNLAGEKFVSFQDGVPIRQAVDKILRERKIRVEHVMELDNIETLKRAVEIEAGISIVPQTTVAQEVAAKTLVRLDIKDGVFEWPLGLIYRKDRVLTQAMREFINILKAGR